MLNPEKAQPNETLQNGKTHSINWKSQVWIIQENRLI